MGYDGPAYANMISASTPEDVVKHHEYNLGVFNASKEDCYLTDIQPTWNYEKPFKTRFRCVFTSYLGWKVYMLMTGAIASDPRHEKT